MASQAPQRPQRLDEPEPVKVRIERWVEGPYPEEGAVFIKIGAESIYAIVPAYSVSVSDGTVCGIKIAQTDDDFYIAMPPSTITHPQLKVPKSLAHEVFAETL